MRPDCCIRQPFLGGNMFLTGYLLSDEKRTEPADMSYRAERGVFEQMGLERQPCHDEAWRQQLHQEQHFQQYF
jgi:hypothetical protein